MARIEGELLIFEKVLAQLTGKYQENRRRWHEEISKNELNGE